MFYVLRYSEPIYRIFVLIQQHKHTLSLFYSTHRTDRTDLELSVHANNIKKINVKKKTIIFIHTQDFSPLINSIHKKNCSYWLNTWLKNNQKLSFYWLYYLRLLYIYDTFDKQCIIKFKGQNEIKIFFFLLFEFYTR